MTVTIDLRPDIEAALVALAAEQGVSLAHYVRRLVEQQIVVPAAPSLSPAERVALWLDAAKRVPKTPTLSDEAMSRESIYDSRG
jgi:hypothetical protein